MNRKNEFAEKRGVLLVSLTAVLFFLLPEPARSSNPPFKSKPLQERCWKEEGEWHVRILTPEVSLSEIAVFFYGDAKEYRGIAEKNGLKNPDQIRLHQILLLPDLPGFRSASCRNVSKEKIEQAQNKTQRQEISTLAPDSPDRSALRDEAEALKAEGKPEASLVLWENLQKADSRDAMAWIEEIKILLKLGKVKEARIRAVGFHRQFPDWPDQKWLTSLLQPDSTDAASSAHPDIGNQEPLRLTTPTPRSSPAVPIEVGP